MKYLLIALFTVSASFMAQAQDEAKAEKPKAIELSSVTEIKKDRLVLDYTFDNWFHKMQNGFETRWYSKGFGMYFMYDLQLGKSMVSIAPGLGFSTSHVHSNGDFSGDGADSLVVGAQLNPPYDLKRNKFVTNWIEVPLELRFRTKPNAGGKSFKLAVGGKFGVKVGSSWKSRKRDLVTDETKIEKVKRFNDVNPIKFGPSVRLGYGPFNIVAFWSATELFRKDRGPDQINPFSIGISINAL